MIIHIKYVKPALTRGLTVRDCGGPQFEEDPESGPIRHHAHMYFCDKKWQYLQLTKFG